MKSEALQDGAKLRMRPARAIDRLAEEILFGPCEAS
jgi:hypothetical protein